MRPDSVRLPALVFGDTRARIETDIHHYTQQVAQVVTSLQCYESRAGAGQFRSKSCVVNINGMRLVAGANTPVIVEVGDCRDLTLMIPFQGESVSTVGKTIHRWRAGESAMLLPSIARGGFSSVRSNLNVDLAPDRLQATAQAMLGQEGDVAIPLDITRDRTLALRYGPLCFATLLRQHCQTIDTLLDTPQALVRLGIDDAIYRSIVMLLNPALFLAQDAARCAQASPASQQRLELVCEYIRAHLDEAGALSLTKLERVSGMSRRSLQMAFQQRFQCSPLQWVMEQKLLAVQARLRNAEADTTVSTIAIHYFPNLGEFSRRYRLRFGELPSVTLARAQRC